MKISLSEFIKNKKTSIEIEKEINYDKKINNHEVINPIKISLKLYKLENSISGIIEVEIRYIEECSRCLAKYENTIKTTEDLIISSEEIEAEDKDADYYYIYLDDDTIDISDFIYEIFNINKPLKPLCNKNCKGLCPECGIDKNKEECNCEDEKTDPRMDKLKDLLDKEV